MKKVLFSLFGLMIIFINQLLFAQDLDKNVALELIQKNADQLAIKNEKNSSVVITNAYHDLGLTYIYVQQSFKNIKLHNVIKSCVFQQSILQSSEGDFITNIASKINNEVPVISASNAVVNAAANINVNLNEERLKIVSDNLSKNNKIIFNDANIARRNIEAELIWFSNDDFNSFKLTWNISIDAINTPDYWTIKVDAASGNIVDKTNYTVYENKFNENLSINKNAIKNCVETKYTKYTLSTKSLFSTAVTSATYRVVPFPYENKNAGAIAIETNPWLKAGSGNNAITNGWHNDGITDYDYTQGNNVFAYDDSLKQNAPGRYPSSTTAVPALTFNFVPNFTKQPTLTVNREFATTNLFYWNNIMHDIMYQYGFNEVSGNFQADNLSRGGVETDYVNAEAQDGGGVNNANFSTPPDGTNGRMQMYLWSTATIKPDGDLDNGVIAHEFGHGISTRLTGGPSNSSCLNNYEQGGEGWSDYFALMVTTNWATAKITDGTKKRPIGTYVVNQTTNGSGIRTYPYSTSMTINPHTYADVADTLNNPQTTSTGVHILNATEVHYIGEVWCSALWDMTWNIIQQVGYINPNIYNASAGGGNDIALKLVMQGLKLQKCSPGFLDARNAILKADSILYNNKFHCAIWDAFARRGMGVSAIQGLSTKTTDQTENFDVPYFNISGRIISPLLTPIKTAKIWSKMYDNYWSLSDTTTGSYQLNVYPIPTPVLFGRKPYDAAKANGVTSVDILLTQRHILNTTKLNSAYKIIAADVDGNKTVNSVDILRMKRLILGTDTTFVSTTRGNRLWEFVDSAYTFPDTTNPFPFKDSISFTNLTSNKTNQTFIGVKLGDVNYDWNPAVAREVAANSLELIVNSEKTTNNNLQLNFTSSNFNNIAALQTTLHFDNTKYEFIGIENGKLQLDYNASKANKSGNIAILWTDKNAEAKNLEQDEVLFTLILHEKSLVNNQLSLTINNDIAATEAWDNNFAKRSIVLTQKVISNKQEIQNNLLVYPNPTKGTFYIDTKNAKQIKLINQMGSVVSIINNVVNHQIINGQKMGKGIYVAEVLYNNGNIAIQKITIE